MGYWQSTWVHLRRNIRRVSALFPLMRWEPESDTFMLSLSTLVRSRFVKIPLAALSRKPESLSHAQAASMTLPWLCAFITVDTLANVKKGDNVIIIGKSRFSFPQTTYAHGLQGLAAVSVPLRHKCATREVLGYSGRTPRSQRYRHRRTSRPSSSPPILPYAT